MPDRHQTDFWRVDRLVKLLIGQWYLVFAAFLAGGLVGMAAMWAWPSAYRATQDIYVAFDPYRMIHDHYVEDIAQRQFTSGDDYKNWQMSQLSAYALHDEVLVEVLQQLAERDDRWASLQASDLRSSMTVGFRNAGDWHLVFEHRDRELAENTVDLWGQVLIDQVNQAVEYGTHIRLVDERIQSLLDQQAELTVREQLLTDVRSDLQAAADALEGLPVDAEVSPRLRSRIHNRVGMAAGWDLAWLSLMEEEPAPGVNAEEELDWVEAALGLIADEMDSIPGTLEAIEAQVGELDTEYRRLLPLTHGFAPTLTIEDPRETAPVQVDRVRHTGTSALVGGGIGLFLLIAYQLLRVTES